MEEAKNVGATLKASYFEGGMSSKIGMYAEDAVVTTDHAQYSGTSQIQSFLDSISEYSVRVEGYNSQPLPGSNLWVIAVLFGTVKKGSDPPRKYHTSFQIEVDAGAHKAVIKRQTFTFCS